MVYLKSDDDAEIDDEEWEEFIPAHKLWFHPGIDYSAEELQDEDRFAELAEKCDEMGQEYQRGAGGASLRFPCPNRSCDENVTASNPLTYGDMLTVDGVARCTFCREAIAAHQLPPDEISPSGSGNP